MMAVWNWVGGYVIALVAVLGAFKFGVNIGYERGFTHGINYQLRQNRDQRRSS